MKIGAPAFLMVTHDHRNRGLLWPIQTVIEQIKHLTCPAPVSLLNYLVCMYLQCWEKQKRVVQCTFIACIMHDSAEGNMRKGVNHGARSYFGLCVAWELAYRNVPFVHQVGRPRHVRFSRCDRWAIYCAYFIGLFRLSGTTRSVM